MAFVAETPTNRAVRQDFPLRHDVDTVKADIATGFLKPTKSVIIHPDVKFDINNDDITTSSSPLRVTVQDFINGYFFSSAALTANRTITTPTATTITSYLGTLLKTNSAGTGLAGTNFTFVLDNVQTGAFTLSLVGGTGVTIQGDGSLEQNEVTQFVLVVHDNDEVVISRVNDDATPVETLAETLTAGNTTAVPGATGTGQNIVLTSGAAAPTGSFITSGAMDDLALAAGAVNTSISSASSDLILAAGGADASAIGSDVGQILLQSGAANASAIQLVANAIANAGGVDIDAGLVTIDTGAGVSIDAAAASNFTVSSGDLTLSVTGVAATDELILTSTGTGSSAIQLNASAATGGVDINANLVTIDTTDGVSIDAGTASNFTVSSGDLTLAVTGVAATDELNLISDGTGAAAIKLFVATGGIDVNYGTNMTISSNGGATSLATFGALSLTLDNGIKFNVGAGAGGPIAGTATLAAGTVVVATTSVTAASIILISRNTPGGVLGNLSVPSASIIAATSFVINSDNGGETSTVNWFILN